MNGTISEAGNDPKAEIIPHRTREDRRAVRHPDRRLLRYEYQRNGIWWIDYTVHENTVQTEYFVQFYGGAFEQKGGA